MMSFNTFTALTFSLALFIVVSFWLAVLPTIGLLWAIGWL